MKHLFIFLKFIFIAKLVHTQIVPSNCYAPDSIKALYRLDSKWLTHWQMNVQSNYYKDSMNLSPVIQDSILGALLAVYNAVPLSARDSVVNTFNIHTDSSFVPQSMIVVVDPGYAWAQKWQQGIAITGNPEVDTLMIKYKLSLSSFYNSIVGPTAILSEPNKASLWQPALISLFKKINGVILSETNGIWSVGPPEKEILYSSDSQGMRYLTYIYRWNPYGMVLWGWYNEHHWKFKLYPDCSVEYLGSAGPPLTTDIVEYGSEFLFSIYPNPASEQIIIHNNSNISLSDIEIKITDLAGQILLERTIYIDQSQEIISIEDYSEGVYILELFVNGKLYTKKIIKQ